jgi:hypothetical protein
MQDFDAVLFSDTFRHSPTAQQGIIIATVHKTRIEVKKWQRRKAK